MHIFHSLGLQTNAAFLDVALLDVYNSDVNEVPRGMVQEWLNCEDILLNFVGTTSESHRLIGAMQISSTLTEYHALR
jgi:hypothetical protein